MKRSCENCHHCRPAENGLLECLRYPPKTFQMMRQNPVTQQPEQGFASVYPQINPRDCPACGEWARSPRGSVVLTEKLDGRIIRLTKSIPQ